MKLTWLGHACFLLEADGYRIVLDPYTDVAGYPPLAVAAHAVYCSHDHFDHNAVDCVTLLPERACPFTVREIPTFHDEQEGALRGPNTVRVFTADGVSVAHLGDLGHQLTAKLRAAIGPVNAVLVPVGGTYTVDAAGAKAVCDTLSAPCVVPMHYRHGDYGFDVLSEAEAFLSLWPAAVIQRLSGPSFTVSGETSGVILPAFEESRA